MNKMVIKDIVKAKALNISYDIFASKLTPYSLFFFPCKVYIISAVVIRTKLETYQLQF